MENSAKIKVEICCGTTCYMLGGADLMGLDGMIPEEWKDAVEIAGVPCLSACVAGELCQAPYVRINGTVMEKATVERVMDELRNRIQSGEGR